MVATFPVFIGNDPAASSNGSDISNSHCDDKFIAVLYGSDIPNFHFLNFQNDFRYDFMTTYVIN